MSSRSLVEDDLRNGRPAVGAVRSRESVQVVHARLREAILDLQLEPGSSLSQVKLAQQFEVSRGPIREALRLLEREGLVRARRNRQVRVAPLSGEDADQLYAMRIVNEALALRITANQLTAEDFARLEDAIAGMAEASDDDATVWEAHHRVFHHGLIYHAGWQVVDLVTQLFDHAERYRRTYLRSTSHGREISARDHVQIFEACKAGETNEAVASLVRHLSRTVLTVIAMVAPEHDPEAVRQAQRFCLGPAVED